MVSRIVSGIAFALLSLMLSGAAFAQTEYDIPDGTGIDYIFYGSYTNTFFSDYQITVNGTLYYVSGYMHFTAGNPAATNGSITFTQYTVTGSTSETDPLTNINYNPFSYKTSTATANFQAQPGGPFGFSGSLTFNIQQFIRPHCYRYCAYDALTTVNGVHSNFTIQ